MILLSDLDTGGRSAGRRREAGGRRRKSAGAGDCQNNPNKFQKNSHLKRKLRFVFPLKQEGGGSTPNQGGAREILKFWPGKNLEKGHHLEKGLKCNTYGFFVP